MFLYYANEKGGRKDLAENVKPKTSNNDIFILCD